MTMFKSRMQELRRKIDYLIDHRDQLNKARSAYRQKAVAFSFLGALRQTEAIYQELSQKRA